VIRCIHRGRLNEILITEQNERPFLIKRSRRYESARPRRLAIECWALNHARDLGLPVPAVITYQGGGGGETIYLEQMSGHKLSEVVTELKLVAFYELGLEIGKLLKRSCKGFGWIDPESQTGVFTDWPAFLGSYVRRYSPKVIGEGIMSESEVKGIYTKLQDLPSVKSTLIHRDLKANNLLMKDGHLTAILDWENAILGDGLFDLAVLSARLGPCSEIPPAAQEGYEKIVGAIDHFRLDLYIPVVLIGEIEFRMTRSYPFESHARRLRNTIKDLDLS
jgi:hypothetical protein